MWLNQYGVFLFCGVVLASSFIVYFVMCALLWPLKKKLYHPDNINYDRWRIKNKMEEMAIDFWNRGKSATELEDELKKTFGQVNNEILHSYQKARK